MTERLRWATMACSKVVGMATHKPSTVVINAVEMPPAMVFGSPVPNRVMAWKVRIMPMTVPSRPSSGATTEIT